MLKIIGAGFGRTGTVSLRVALEKLGYGKCYHMLDIPSNPNHIGYWEAASRGEPVNWPALFEGYQSVVDFPGCCFYKSMLEQYPSAKVILSVRDPDKWYDSAAKTIQRPKLSLPMILTVLRRLPFSRNVRRMPFVMMSLDRIITKGIFGGRFGDKQHAVNVYLDHNEDVKQSIPKDQLLVFNVKDGWDPLCDFLKVPVPANEPFPHANEGVDFKEMELELISNL